jgi:hypothetical protein
MYADEEVRSSTDLTRRNSERPLVEKKEDILTDLKLKNENTQRDWLLDPMNLYLYGMARRRDIMKSL